MSVPEQVTQVPSEYAFCASSAPVDGCPSPSGTPYVIAAAGDTIARTLTRAIAARDMRRIGTPSVKRERAPEDK
jgi:hypothetical protein